MAEKQEENKQKLEISESLAGSTDCETIYLPEEEIQAYIDKYMKENPNVEIETRYVNPPNVEYTQEIQVRWLRPETPNELPPIIIREVNQSEPEQKPLRIVELPKKQVEKEEKRDEPIVIREKPPVIHTNPEAQYIYVEKKSKEDSSSANTINKKQVARNELSTASVKNQAQGFFYKELPVVHHHKPKVMHEELHSLNHYHQQHTSSRHHYHDQRNIQAQAQAASFYSNQMALSHNNAFNSNVDYNNINNYKQHVPINTNKYNIYNYLYVPNGGAQQTAEQYAYHHQQQQQQQQQYQHHQYGYSTNSISNRIIR